MFSFFWWRLPVEVETSLRCIIFLVVFNTEFWSVLCTLPLVWTVYVTGYLCAGNDSEHIQPGTRLELPLWMARSLCSRRRRIATVEVPRPYRSGHRKILDADAAVVDLHKFCPYYYRVGTHLLAFDLTESVDIARSMLLVLFSAYVASDLFLIIFVAFFKYSFNNNVGQSSLHCLSCDGWRRFVNFNSSSF